MTDTTASPNPTHHNELSSVFTRDEVEALADALPEGAVVADYVNLGDTDKIARVVGAFPKLMRTALGLFALLDAAHDDIARLENDAHIADLYRVASRFDDFGGGDAESAMRVAVADLGAVSSAVLPASTMIWKALGAPPPGQEDLAAAARSGIVERLLRNGALRRQWVAYLVRFDALARAVDLAAQELGCGDVEPMPTTAMSEAEWSVSLRGLVSQAEARSARLERELASRPHAEDPRVAEFIRVCVAYVRSQRGSNRAPIVVRAVGPDGEVPGQLLAATGEGVVFAVRGIIDSVPPGGQLLLNFGNSPHTFASVSRGENGSLAEFMAPAEASAIHETVES